MSCLYLTHASSLMSFSVVVLKCLGIVGALTACVGHASPPVVQIPDLGSLRGKSYTGRFGDVALFLGIPYAKAPVGDLRWRSPVTHGAWRSPRDATEYGNICMQTPSPGTASLNISEDCLYLNIWAPWTSLATARPTLLFLHGGAFMTGSGYEELNCAFYT